MSFIYDNIDTGVKSTTLLTPTNISCSNTVIPISTEQLIYLFNG